MLDLLLYPDICAWLAFFMIFFNFMCDSVRCILFTQVHRVTTIEEHLYTKIVLCVRTHHHTLDDDHIAGDGAYNQTNRCAFHDDYIFQHIVIIDYFNVI